MEIERITRCRTQGFQYKFNVFNTPMHISYSKSGGSFWDNPTLRFDPKLNSPLGPGWFFYVVAPIVRYRASNAFAPGVPLFTAVSDGDRNCTIETFQNSDPISTLLAAYSIACRLDPKEFGSGTEKMCERHIRLGMWPGHSEFIGMEPEDFEREFSYSAEVPPPFQEEMSSFDRSSQRPIPMFSAAGPPQ